MAIDAAIGVTGAATREAAKPQPHRFYLGMAFACALTVFSGFAPSFYLRPASLPPLATAVVAHGIGMTCWVVLFLVQTMLAAAGRIKWHRWLGPAGAALAATLVLSGVPLALSGARRGIFAGDSLAFLLVILVDLLAFSAFAAAGIYTRRQREMHRTFMLLAMISLLPPAVFRWPVAVTHPLIIPAVVLTFVAAVIAHDLLIGRLRAASLIGAIALLVSLPLRIAISNTSAWHSVAHWLVLHTTP
jgi:hypothetical protein